MADHYPIMIPNADNSGEVLEVKAPYDLSTIATCDTAGSEAIQQALQTAYALYSDKSQWLKADERIAILEKAGEIMQERFEELAVEAAREGGKPLIDSRVEVARAIDGMKLCVEHLRTSHGEEIPMSLNASSMGRLAFTTKEPIGVVVAVSAFNHPINLIVHQVAPAVATGCPVIVKPSGDTPLSCFRFVAILREAGLPEAWCQAAATQSSSVATELVTDKRVGFFSFIGSAGVGWMLRSKLAPGTRCALEHGGVAPVIVADDANMGKALPALVKGGFYHAGQVCVSVQRIYAHESIARDLAEKIAAEAKQLTIGDPTSADTDIGPMIRPTEVDRVEEWVNQAKGAGTEVLCGGDRVSDTCYQCTVLYDPADDLNVSQKEVFGPVVCVYPFANMDEAITRANSLSVSFQSAVFSQDIDKAMLAVKGLDASAVMINDHTAFRVDWMPFAGLKESGHGIGGIPHTMHDMQVEKMIVIRSDAL